MGVQQRCCSIWGLSTLYRGAARTQQRMAFWVGDSPWIGRCAKRDPVGRCTERAAVGEPPSLLHVVRMLLVLLVDETTEVAQCGPVGLSVDDRRTRREEAILEDGSAQAHMGAGVRLEDIRVHPLVLL